MTYHLKYPLGKFEKPDLITPDLLSEWITTIAAFPEDLANEVGNLSDQELNTSYRDEGWTIRQVVHHCADSHINAYCRFKLAITEDNPVIKPYYEDRWAELPDSKDFPIHASLSILHGLHARWSALIESLDEKALARTFIHPQHGQTFTLAEVVGMYAWHCRHHLAHVTQAKKKIQELGAEQA